MTHAYEDIERVLYPLVRIGQAMRAAQSRVIDPTRQAILQQAAVKGQVRPSDLAAELDLYPSSITRQTKALESDGFVTVDADPADRRSCLIALTEAGQAEVVRLTRLGLDRFADFLAEWDAEDVRTLGALLNRLEATVAEARQRRARKDGRHWQRRPDGE